MIVSGAPPTDHVAHLQQSMSYPGPTPCGVRPRAGKAYPQVSNLDAIRVHPTSLQAAGSARLWSGGVTITKYNAGFWTPNRLRPVSGAVCTGGRIGRLCCPAVHRTPGHRPAAAACYQSPAGEHRAQVTARRLPQRPRDATGSGCPVV